MNVMTSIVLVVALVCIAIIVAVNSENKANMQNTKSAQTTDDKLDILIRQNAMLQNQKSWSNLWLVLIVIELCILTFFAYQHYKIEQDAISTTNEVISGVNQLFENTIN